MGPCFWKLRAGLGKGLVQDFWTGVGRFGLPGTFARSCSRQSALVLQSCRLEPLPRDVG